jgi:hypothetical protein
MESKIKTLIFKTGDVVISQIDEIETEFGEPNCKLIKPFKIHHNESGENTVTRWLSEYTNQDVILINSDSLLTIVDSLKDHIKLYIDFISE